MINTSERVNTDRERSNLLCLIKLTLNTLIDHSSSASASPVLDDRNSDVTNFILTLERVLNFRMKLNWLAERRFFWDFVRPASIGSGRQNIIERVEDVSKNRTIKEKGRTWIKFALMEKKLSELLKLVISDCHLVRKFYSDDSIMSSSQAFVLCDQLAGLSAIDFSFCFKQDLTLSTSQSVPLMEVDVIDLTPFLCYKSKSMKQYLKEQNGDDENKQPMVILGDLNEMKPLKVAEREMISMDKFKLEMEQRKYFEDLYKNRDREYQQLKSNFEKLKSDREKEVRLMENIILELQIQLGATRNEIESKQKTSTSPVVEPMKSPSKKSLLLLTKQKLKIGTQTTNERDSIDVVMSDVPTDNKTIQLDETSNGIESTVLPNISSRRSSQSTTTSNTDDDQFEVVRDVLPNPTNQNAIDIKEISSPELLSSATSLISSSSSSSSNDEIDETSEQNSLKPMIDESGHFEPVEITAEQVNLLEEATTTNTSS